MLVSLYTVRVVLNTLGVQDYGIYNVTAGVVTMFGFLSGAMATAGQRYFSFELGRGDYEQLKKVFSLSLVIYILIAAAVLLLSETIGLWFVSYKLVIPIERRTAALWVYQFSVISFLFTILTSPYMAMIIAHEDMKIYAYVSIVEVILRLGMVFLLKIILSDKLQLYGLLMCVITIIITFIYRKICANKYVPGKYTFFWNIQLFKDIASFTGWSLFGNLTTIIRIQATTILLNQFFNPIVVAARSISMQVNNVVATFSNNFSIALQPQITKSYSAGEKDRMFRLIFQGAKGTYFLVLVFAMPLILEMPFILLLWLKEPPEYAVIFTRLVVIDTLINSISYPLMTAARAPGRMRLYESILGSIQLVCFLITWIVFLEGGPAYSAMLVSIGISAVMFIARLLIVRYILGFPVLQFIIKTIIPISITSLISVILPILVLISIRQSFLRLFIVLITSVISSGLGIFSLGLNKEERTSIKIFIMKRIKKETNLSINDNWNNTNI